MNNPEYVKVGNKKYKLNTDFRVALKCNQLSMDKTIGDTERTLAIVYLLFGEEGLSSENDFCKLIDLGYRYLTLDREPNNDDIEPDMDFIKDMDYIETSFMSDYKIDLTNTKMHYWKFYNLLEGLSNSEFGNCCILNKIRNARTFDASKIEDKKEREEFLKYQESISLKPRNKVELTKEQEESMRKLDEIIGFKK